MNQLLQSEKSIKLSVDQFYARFDEAILQTRVSSRKVEALQFYDESDDPSWRKMREGDWAGALALLHLGMSQEAANELRDLVRQGISVTRLRIIEYPLTDYVRWELETYKLSAELGEAIYLIDKALLASEEILPDFVAFDEWMLMTLDYSSEGALIAAHEFQADRVVSEIVMRYDALLARAIPLSSFKYESPAS